MSEAWCKGMGHIIWVVKDDRLIVGPKASTYSDCYAAPCLPICPHDSICPYNSALPRNTWSLRSYSCSDGRLSLIGQDVLLTLIRKRSLNRFCSRRPFSDVTCMIRRIHGILFSSLERWWWTCTCTGAFFEKSRMKMKLLKKETIDCIFLLFIFLYWIAYNYVSSGRRVVVFF